MGTLEIVDTDEGTQVVRPTLHHGRPSFEEIVSEATRAHEARVAKDITWIARGLANDDLWSGPNAEIRARGWAHLARIEIDTEEADAMAELASVSSYVVEFPEAEYLVPDDMLAMLAEMGFQDQSWHNDVCPHFWHEQRRVAVWTGPSEDAPVEAPRYSVNRTDDVGANVDDDFTFCSTVSETREAIMTLMNEPKIGDLYRYTTRRPLTVGGYHEIVCEARISHEDATRVDLEITRTISDSHPEMQQTIRKVGFLRRFFPGGSPLATLERLS